MKTLITLLFTLMLSAAQAQISDVKEANGTLQIINESGNYSGYINLSRGYYLAGFNSQYVVVVDDNNQARIYNSKGDYTSSYISLCSGCTVKNVTSSNILITEGSKTKRYDFKGNYLGEY